MSEVGVSRVEFVLGEEFVDGFDELTVVVEVA